VLAGLEAYGTSVVELMVPSNSDLIGKALSHLVLPEESVLASIVRGGVVVFPKPNTKLAATII